MPAKPKKLLTWSPGRDAALAAWVKRGAELGVSFKPPRGAHSDSLAVEEALKRAVSCRCEERAMLALAEQAATARSLAEPPANPLRTLREEAGLSQAEAASLCGMTRGAWANVEKAGKATPAMVERARKALGTK